jgi:hypothetical protein
MNTKESTNFSEEYKILIRAFVLEMLGWKRKNCIK